MNANTQAVDEDYILRRMYVPTIVYVRFLCRFVIINQQLELHFVAQYVFSARWRQNGISSCTTVALSPGKKQFSSYRDRQPQRVLHERTNHDCEMSISRVSAVAGANSSTEQNFYV